MEEVGEAEETEVFDPQSKVTDLYAAVKENKTDAAMDLLNLGVPPTHVDEDNGWTAINWAAKYGNIKVLRKILDMGGSQGYCDAKTCVGDDSPEVLLTDPDKSNLYIYLKLTPLHLAVFQGHQRAVWLLLNDYSPDDTNDMGNSSLHIAAAQGHIKILEILLNNGANPHILNVYKNHPCDVAKTHDIKKLLLKAMDRYSTLDNAAKRLMHIQNLNKYTDSVTNLSEAVSNAAKVETSRMLRSVDIIEDTIKELSHTLDQTVDMGLDDPHDDQLLEGRRIIIRLKALLELLNYITTAQNHIPIRSQREYEKYILDLERAVLHAESVGLDKFHTQHAKDLVIKSQIEYLLSTALERLKHVNRAVNANEQDMIMLRHFVKKAQALQASDDMVDMAISRLKRLEGELEMTRAILAVPIVKLPIENPPEGYYGAEDTGHIVETEEFPLPPPSNNEEYIWEHSISYTKLFNSIERLRNCTNGADGFGANPEVIAEAKEKLTKVEKEMKLLDAKDAEDKRIQVEIAVKAAKKLKKGKKPAASAKK